ncbi:hypothetical protein RRG08_003418 [Elysia crispata]|uniref:Uncharacterized protein n=1 Tax=Elysia crispata TaxID=231223 RepID=A0AAE1AB13_9GAST|nr:hypothetical protein RRG08_003418 [Elysia crispata]
MLCRASNPPNPCAKRNVKLHFTFSKHLDPKIEKLEYEPGKEISGIEVGIWIESALTDSPSKHSTVECVTQQPLNVSHKPPARGGMCHTNHQQEEECVTQQPLNVSHKPPARGGMCHTTTVECVTQTTSKRRNVSHNNR